MAGGSTIDIADPCASAFETGSGSTCNSKGSTFGR